MADTQQLVAGLHGPLQCMACNWRQQLVAVSSSCDIEIWSWAEQGQVMAWSMIAVLQGHDHPVSGLDWDNPDDLLVSCSHDRNAYVWCFNKQSNHDRSRLGNSSLVDGAPGWTRQRVETRLKRGCLCVKWSPLSKKIAIGSANRAISVAYYDSVLGIWASLQIARGSSTGSVTCVAWHPEAHILAAGSTDGCVRLFTATCPEADSQHAPPAAAAGQPWSSVPNTFGQLLVCVRPPELSWVHALTWASAEQLLFCTHSSQLHVCSTHVLLKPPDVSQPIDGTPTRRGTARESRQEVCSTVQLPGCPLKTLLTVRHDLVIGGGWDGVLLVMRHLPPQLDNTAQRLAPMFSTWALKCILGQFSPGMQPVLCPEHLRRGSSRLSVPVPPNVPGASSQDAHSSLPAWEQVLSGATPAHAGCVTGLTVLSTAPTYRDAQKAGEAQGYNDVVASPRCKPDQQLSPVQASLQKLGILDKGLGKSTQAAQATSATKAQGVLRLHSVGLDGKLIMWTFPANL